MIRWNEELWLLTLDEYKELPDGTKLKSINNKYAVKGVDYIDDGTRYGCLAYGLTGKLVEEQNLQCEFLVLVLKSY